MGQRGITLSLALTDVNGWQIRAGLNQSSRLTSQTWRVNRTVGRSREQEVKRDELDALSGSRPGACLLRLDAAG
jgi:hypothetical protein